MNIEDEYEEKLAALERNAPISLILTYNPQLIGDMPQLCMWTEAECVVYKENEEFRC
jgi:hypothetical protein